MVHSGSRILAEGDVSLGIIGLPPPATTQAPCPVLPESCHLRSLTLALACMHIRQLSKKGFKYHFVCTGFITVDAIHKLLPGSLKVNEYIQQNVKIHKGEIIVLERNGDVAFC